MNWEQIKGNWNQLKGGVKVQWGKLTDDDLQRLMENADGYVGNARRYAAELVDITPARG